MEEDRPKTSCTTCIAVMHAGMPLVGIATATLRDLAVEMVEPFPGLVARRHLIFPVEKLRYVEDGKLTAAGRSRADALLVDLFVLESWLRCALNAAQTALKNGRIDLAALEGAVAARLDPLFAGLKPLDRDAFLVERRALRRDLRGGLDPRIYQRRLGALRRRHRAADLWQAQLVLGLARGILAALPEVGPAPLSCEAAELLVPHVNGLRAGQGRGNRSGTLHDASSKSSNEGMLN